MIPLAIKALQKGLVMFPSSAGRRFPALSVLLLASAVAFAEPLPELNVDPADITVSGISSGAFMAVQFGVAHSSRVSGIAAIAGGPYFCASRDAWAGAGLSRVIARCMQGDPAFPAQPIRPSDLAGMVAATRAWAATGRIDPVDGLARQRIWLFQGYNDGIVRPAVGEALVRWLAEFVPPAQIFRQDAFNAGHAQITAACGADGAACQPCATSGGDFINACPDADGRPYDAGGAALQFLRGPLKPGTAGALHSYDQRPYTQREARAVPPLAIAMADTGYLYVPADCAAGQPCRLHIAFHGCLQAVGSMGDGFAARAGYNAWAENNHLVVLYPQAAATVGLPGTPFNPQACWDWWGYNDFGWTPVGRYATQAGEQIAAVRRMVDHLTAGYSGDAARAADGFSGLRLVDRADDQIALAWSPLAGARAYRIYRDAQPVADELPAAAWADGGLQPATDYHYRVVGLDDSGGELPLGELTARTRHAPPACDPHFSLARGEPVDVDNRPTSVTCP